jgi:hypothetical protein
MSKNLFNQNTFGNKNVINDDDVTIATAETITAKTITTTDLNVTGTLTNTELQNATTNIANNTSQISGFADALAGKQDTLSTGNGIDITGTTISFDGTSITGNINLTSANGNITTTGDITSGSSLKFTDSGNVLQDVENNFTTLTTAVNGKQATLTTGDGIDITGTTISFDGTISQGITSSGDIQGLNLKYLDGGVVTDVKTKIDTNATAITGKQATLSQGNGIDITGTTISFDGTSISSGITATGDIVSGANLKYTDGSDVLKDVEGEIQTLTTAVSGKQATITSGSVNANLIFQAGSNLSFDATTSPYTLNATGGGSSVTALANGGLAVNGSNEISLDFNNTNATIQIPQRLEIINDTTAQLVVKPNSTTGQDAAITIRGSRNGTSAVRQAQLRFENYDNDLTATNDLFEIAGVVTDPDANIGGMVISNYANGSTRTGNTSMSPSGNWYFGGGGAFQDVYGVRVDGTAYFSQAVTFNSTITLTQPITQDIDIGAKITTNQLLVDTANSIATAGSSDTAVNISEGLLLCDGGTGNGQTQGGGVIQINCRNSGKLSEGMCMRAIDNNNNCINFRSTSDSARGRIDGDGGSKVKYRTSSDVRLKENIEDMDSCWELLKTAQPRKFRWIEDQTDDVGFIAQEIYTLEGFRTLKPTTDKYNCCDNSLNTFDEDGYCENPMESEGVIYPHALDYGNFTPYLWKALQEAITKIETLETKVADLEAQLIV